MATNKNQHFVPRCYLRPFSVEGKGAAIHLYNIDRRRFIRFAPVKNQCSGNYFYGRDEKLEKAIQAVEGGYGTALREILRPGYALTDSHRAVLRMFWLFQHLRTEAAAARSVEMAASMREVARVTDSSFRLAIEEAVFFAMRTFADEMHIVDDLKLCLVKNKSKIPFFTSDDPAVLTNRWWLTDNRTQGHSFGLRSAGAIIMLRISPKLLCLGYDGNVYSVAHKRGIVDVRNASDIASFNEHQVLNCRANLFVQDPQYECLVDQAFRGVKERRPASRHNIHYAVLDYEHDGYTRYRVVDPADEESHKQALIHSQVVHPVPHSWPLQISFRRKGVVFTNGTGLGYVRLAATLQYTRIPFSREPA